MLTVSGYASPAQAEFFESMGLLFSSGQGQARRFIHSAKDACGFLAIFYKFIIREKDIWRE
jgi:hypothetical protein